MSARPRARARARARPAGTEKRATGVCWDGGRVCGAPARLGCRAGPRGCVAGPAEDTPCDRLSNLPSAPRPPAQLHARPHQEGPRRLRVLARQAARHVHGGAGGAQRAHACLRARMHACACLPTGGRAPSHGPICLAHARTHAAGHGPACACAHACARNSPIPPPPRPPPPQLTAYGKVDNADEAGMMSEIMQRGPITCGVAAPDDFVYSYHSAKNGGVYVDSGGGGGLRGGGAPGGRRVRARAPWMAGTLERPVPTPSPTGPTQDALFPSPASDQRPPNQRPPHQPNHPPQRPPKSRHRD